MKNVLIKNGFDVSAVCVTGAQAIQAVERLEAGVVVCGIRFADMIYDELKSVFQILLRWSLLPAMPSGRNMEMMMSFICHCR